MTLRYRWHRALGHLWWRVHRPVEWPLGLPRLYDKAMYGHDARRGRPRVRRGDRLYDALWPVFGRASGWCVDRALWHWERASGTGRG